MRKRERYGSKGSSLTVRKGASFSVLPDGGSCPSPWIDSPHTGKERAEDSFRLRLPLFVDSFRLATDREIDGGDRFGARRRSMLTIQEWQVEEWRGVVRV